MHTCPDAKYLGRKDIMRHFYTKWIFSQIHNGNEMMIYDVNVNMKFEDWLYSAREVAC